MNCPYCFNLNRIDLTNQVQWFDIYFPTKCNHCSREFIYKLKLEADCFPKPE